MANLAYAALDRWRGPYHACQPSSFRIAGKPLPVSWPPRTIGAWPLLST